MPIDPKDWPETDVCTVCHIEKSLEDFPLAKSGKYGHRRQCKACCVKATMSRYEYHPKPAVSEDQWPDHKVCSKCKVDKPLEAYGQSKAGLYGRKSQCNECGKAFSRQYRRDHPEKTAAATKKWSEAHYELKLAIGQAYRDERPELQLVNSARSRAMKYALTEHFNEQELIDLLTFYNYSCLCCGKSQKELGDEKTKKLTIDHVVALSKDGTNLIDNIQPLCWDCNRAKWMDEIDYRLTYGGI